MITLGSLCLHAAQLMKGSKSIIGLKKADDHVQFGLISKKENESTFQTEHHLVPMLSVDVKSSIENDAAKVGVTQVYKNTTTETMDVYYCLSINADGGSFQYFKADVDGVNVKNVSKLTVNDEDFENSGVSTGILEFFKWLAKGNHPGVYQIPICSLNPESSIQIRLGYEYKLIQQGNKLRFFIPRTIVPKSTLLPFISDDQETFNINPALSIKVTLLVSGLIDSLESPSHPNITVVGKFEDPQRKGWTQAQVKYTGYATDLFEDFVLLIEKPEEVTPSGDLHNNNDSDSMSLPTKYIKSFLEGFSRFKGNTNVNAPTEKEGTELPQTQNETLNTLSSETENIFATEDVNFISRSVVSVDYSIMKMLENPYIASRNTLVNVAKETSDIESVMVENSELDTNNKIENEGFEKLVVLHSVSNESQERFCTNTNSEMLEIPETVPGEDNSSPVITDSSLESSQPGNTEIKTEEIPEAEISPVVAPDESPSDHSEQDQFLEDFQSFHGKAAEAIELKKSLDETTTVNANENKSNELENQDGPILDIDLKPEVTEEREKDIVNDSGAEIPPAEIETSIANNEKDNAEVSEVTTTVSSASTQKKFNFSQPRMTKLSVCRANLIAKNSAAGISNKETPSVTSSANNESSQPKPKPANVYRKSAAAPLPPKDSHKATAPGVAKTSSYTTSNLKKTTSKSKNVTERPNTAKWRNASLDRKKVTFANANPPKPLVSDKDVSKILINLQTSSGQFELSPILTALVSQDLDNIRQVAKDKGWTESSVGTGLALAFFTGKLSDQKALWTETFDKGKKWLTSHYPKKTDEILEYMAHNIFNE